MAEKQTSSDQVRATDAERRKLVDKLGRGLAFGCLTMDEFEERVAAAWAATTRGDLAGLAADIPSLPKAGCPSWSARAMPFMRGLTAFWMALSALSVGLWGLLALAGSADIATAWWILLVVGGMTLVVPLWRVAQENDDSPPTA